MKPDMREIAHAAALHFDIPFERLFGQSRKRIFTRPRQIAMYLCKQLGGRTYPAIGQFFGGRDHTTALHASQTIGKQVMADDQILSDIMTVAAIASGISALRQDIDRGLAQSLRPKKKITIKKPHVYPPPRVRWILIPERNYARGPRRPVVLPSEFAPPSKARLMGARA